VDPDLSIKVNTLNILAGYDAFFASHSGVLPLAVDVTDFENSLGHPLISALEASLQASRHRVRALVLSNPHNPLGRCYSADVLESCAQFCQTHDIHLVSDEVFALSQFDSPDLPKAPKFTSILDLDLESLNVDPNRIHMIWSLSKDFAASGARIVSTTFNGSNSDYHHSHTTRHDHSTTDVTNFVRDAWCLATKTL
jgi:aspartate/methionine/tyrosine aminotransferase